MTVKCSGSQFPLCTHSSEWSDLELEPPLAYTLDMVAPETSIAPFRARTHDSSDMEAEVVHLLPVLEMGSCSQSAVGCRTQSRVYIACLGIQSAGSAKSCRIRIQNYGDRMPNYLPGRAAEVPSPSRVMS